MEKEFINIITKHQGIILKVCRMYSKGHSDAEDLFQEITIQLWRSYPMFADEAKVTTWMYRIALNTAITRLRKGSRHLKWHALSYQQLNYAQPDEQRIDIVYEQELQMALDKLNRFDKALVLLYLDEKSYKEMAEIMELSESNIGVKINRIKRKLKQILNP